MIQAQLILIEYWMMIMMDAIRIIFMKALNLQAIIMLKAKKPIIPGYIMMDQDPMGVGGSSTPKIRQVNKIQEQTLCFGQYE